MSVWGGIPHHKLDKLFIIQKKCIRILFGDTEKYKDKHCTCVRARPLGAQKLGSEFYAKEHSKPLFNSHKLLTVHNLYIYLYTIHHLKYTKYWSWELQYQSSHYSICLKCKTTLIITPSPTMYFIYKSAILWNLINRLIFSNLIDFSMKICTMKASVKQYLYCCGSLTMTKITGAIKTMT